MKSPLHIPPLEDGPSDTRLVQSQRLKFFSAIAGFIVILFGAGGLLGWTFQIQFLKSGFHDLPSMMPITALAFVLLGFSLWLQHGEQTGNVPRRIAQGCAWTVVFFGAVIISEFVFKRETGLDQFLFKEQLSKLRLPNPGRPAFLTALNFFLLGLALAFLDVKGRDDKRHFELLTVTAILISLLALIGYACNVPLFYGWNSPLPGGSMALLSVVAFTMLGTGILCARAEHGLAGIYLSPTASGMMTRRLLLAPVAIPLATGGVKMLAQRFGIFNQEFAGWLFAFSNIFIFTLGIWWSARLLYRAEMVRIRAEAKLNELNAKLEERVTERTTELSRAMATLQANEERVRLTLDTAMDAVITMDSSGLVTSWNREAETTFGWTRREMIGQPLSTTIIPQSHREAHERGLKHYLATQEGPVLNKRIEITALHRDGREFPVELAITPIRLADNLFFSAFIRDITRRKRSEAVAGQLAAIVESSADAIIGKDLNSIITSWNNGAEKIFGYTAGEMMGTSITRLIPTDRQNEENQLLEQIKVGEKVKHFETLRQTKSGQLIDISVTASPIKNAQGKVIGASKVARDITDRKRAEDELRKSQARFSAVFRSAPVAMSINTISGGRLIEANEQYCKFFGYARDEIVGRSVLDLNIWANPEERAPMVQRLLKEGSIRGFEVKQRRRSGEVRDVLASLELIELAGESEPVLISMFIDITERNQAERKIHNLNAELEHRVAARTAQLQTANEELEAFSYSVSHDLRAPLRHVAGFINLLQKDAGPTLSEKSLRHVATISQAAKRMGTLIDDLLVFSRIGKSDMQKKQIDLDELVHGVLIDFETDTKKRGIAWNIEPLPSVWADQSLLRLVVTNLLSNAVKFTGVRAHPKIDVGCAPVHNGETVIFIRDNGAGFDPQYAHKLFGVFQRLHRSEEFEGTGIGLANVRRIISRHGGRTWAEGVLDAGATFYFSIPKPTAEQ